MKGIELGNYRNIISITKIKGSKLKTSYLVLDVYANLTLLISYSIVSHYLKLCTTWDIRCIWWLTSFKLALHHTKVLPKLWDIACTCTYTGNSYQLVLSTCISSFEIYSVFSNVTLICKNTLGWHVYLYRTWLWPEVDAILMCMYVSLPSIVSLQCLAQPRGGRWRTDMQRPQPLGSLS